MEHRGVPGRDETLVPLTIKGFRGRTASLEVHGYGGEAVIRVDRQGVIELGPALPTPYVVRFPARYKVTLERDPETGVTTVRAEEEGGD